MFKGTGMQFFVMILRYEKEDIQIEQFCLGRSYKILKNSILF